MSLLHRISSGLARALALAALVFILPRLASAGLEQETSLDFIPADASFYSSSLRWREQFEVARGSKAWKQIQEMPAVQMGWQMLAAQLAQPNNPLSTAQQLLELPENQQLLELLTDMVSNEVFAYGDPSVTRFVTALADAYGDAQATNMIHAFQQGFNRARTGEHADRTTRDNREGARAFLQSLAAHLDDLTIPNLVLGFKISKTEPAQTQLKRLEVLTKMVLGMVPQLNGRLKRAKVGDTEYLTLALDGSLVPWEEIPWQDFEDEPDEFAPLIAKLKTLTLNISLGVRGDYLLASVGSSNEHLVKLGQGKLLVDQPELKPLAAFTDKPLTSVTYCSGELRSSVSTTKKDFEQLGHAASGLLDQLEIDKPLRERVLADVKKFIDDVNRYVPNIGPTMSFSFLTERGSESYTYDWTDNLFIDASKPLTLLDHLGGNPLAALVVRGKQDPQQWDLLVKWTQIAYGYFQEFALPELEADQRAHFDTVADLALPLINRFANATRDLLLPALSDGQSALLLDAKISSRQWQKDMPKAGTSLPMLEPAIVLGVSDAKLLKRAVSEYLAIANQAIVEIRKLNPQAIPAGFQLPPPEKSETTTGDHYAYAIPADAGVDPQITPDAGLSENLVVFSIARTQAQAVLESKPLALPKALGDDKQPLAGVAWFDWAALVDAVLPWVDYGQQVAEDNRGPDPQTAFILDHVRTGLKVFKVLRTYASVTYTEGKALVVHSEVHLRDLD